MKALLYLIGLIAAGCFLIWVIYDLPPEQQLNNIKKYINSANSTISSHISDTTSSAKKLKNRLSSEFDQASDVYTKSQE